MWFGAVTCLLSLVTLGDAAAKPKLMERAESVKIYAYGTGIAGLPVNLGADGKAYISKPSDNVTSITWDIDPTGSLPWNLTSTDNSTLAASSFYIITESGAFEPAGFVDTNSTLPSGAATTGFITYGPYVMYLSGNTYVSEFWAKTTNTTGLWTLMWNQDGTDEADSEPITLKTTAPITD
ncbi:hypothetical protein NKR23_g1013 [Pleurostoma richardsiae]|uniref:Uncharacterized protein n=1 Tax=Pleurostoma richardsiae TaxID=41990 RepID=A0AA38SCR3_9PEZI|nr:hypothetical protein NKR23_g1013 [Pleurostoma richardsiae]